MKGYAGAIQGFFTGCVAWLKLVQHTIHLPRDVLLLAGDRRACRRRWNHRVIHVHRVNIIQLKIKNIPTLEALVSDISQAWVVWSIRYFRVSGMHVHIYTK